MPDSAPSELTALPTRQTPGRVWRTWLALVLGAAGIAMLALWLQPPPPPFELLTANEYERRIKRFAFIRDARARMIRFSPKIFGFDRVQITGAYMADSVSNVLAQLPQPQYSTNGVRVWVLASNVVAKTQRDWRTFDTANWRVTTSEGIPSGLSSSTSTGKRPTVEFANYPNIRSGNVDLAAKFTAIIPDRETGAGSQHITNQVVFRLLLKRDEGGILFDGKGVLFIWSHAP